MSDDRSSHPEALARTPALEHEAPNTLEGWSVLHQVFRLRREALGALDAARRERILRQAAGAISAMERREDGESALFSILGHKGDLLALHFRRSFDELERAQADIAALELERVPRTDRIVRLDGRDRVVRGDGRVERAACGRRVCVRIRPSGSGRSRKSLPHSATRW